MPSPNTDYGRCRSSGALNNLGLYREHATPDGTLAEDKEGRLSICFVRNPITWYRSLWAFRIQTKSYDPKFPPDLLMDDDLEIFINNVIDEFPNGFVTELYQCYVGENADGVDFIGKQEYLKDDFEKALNLAGQEFDRAKLRNLKMMRVAGSDRKLIKRIGSTSHETLDRIMSAEKWVFDTFYSDYV
jgi:hypothetical protein